MTKYLFKFEWRYRRGGSVEGLFVSTEEEVKALIGRQVNFGEALGKHSEVYGEIEEGDVVKLDVSTEAVAEVSDFLGRTWSGYNPFSYLRAECSECGMGCDEEDAVVEGIVYRGAYERILCEECFEEAEEELDE